MNVPRNLKVTCLKENVFVVDEMATLMLMVQLTNNINENLTEYDDFHYLTFHSYRLTVRVRMK